MALIISCAKGESNECGPANRTMAPALGLLTLAMMKGMSKGECVKETEIPSARSCCCSSRLSTAASDVISR